MKHARDDDDDDATSGSSAMGDDDPHHQEEEEDDDDDGEEEEEQEQRRRRRAIPCDVLLSLSLPCWSSSSSSRPSTSCSIHADHQAATDTGAGGTAPPLERRHRRRRGLDDNVFACRTRGRRFPTFQALGGHRTSHLRRQAAMTKKPARSSTAVMMVHACAMCGLGFSTGQALGGHMRRHRRLGRAGSVDGFPSTGDVDLTQIIVHGRPASSSLQLLNLFV